MKKVWKIFLAMQNHFSVDESGKLRPISSLGIPERSNGGLDEKISVGNNLT